MVGDMAALGLVVVEADPADARARLVRFTPQGLRTIRRGLGVLEAVGEELAARVGAPRMERLGRDLRALLAALEAPDGEPPPG
ncbi:MAG: MarR family winged helix-turn-helix transcriptional regulator [Burkholderiaceae bacterium]